MMCKHDSPFVMGTYFFYSTKLVLSSGTLILRDYLSKEGLPTQTVAKQRMGWKII